VAIIGNRQLSCQLHVQSLSSLLCAHLHPRVSFSSPTQPGFSSHRRSLWQQRQQCKAGTLAATAQHMRVRHSRRCTGARCSCPRSSRPAISLLRVRHERELNACSPLFRGFIHLNDMASRSELSLYLSCPVIRSLGAARHGPAGVLV